jgi:AAA family ATPase
MIIKLLVDGPRRTFVVDTINNRNTTLGESLNCSVKILSEEEVAAGAQIPASKVAPLQLANIAGIDQALEKLNGFLGEFTLDFAFPWAHNSGAVLLHGGHGSGKTFVLNHLANSGWGKVFRLKRKDAKPAIIEKLFSDARYERLHVVTYTSG